MSAHADWRTFAFLGSLGLFALLFIAGGVTRLLRKPAATLWLASLARFALVFFLAFTLLNIGALLAPAVLDPLGLHSVARYIDEAEVAVVWAALSVVAACAGFWDRFHRPQRDSKA
jgi:hypothetical protein